MKDAQAEGERSASGGDEWALFVDKDLSFADAQPARQIYLAAAVMIVGDFAAGIASGRGCARLGTEAELTWSARR
jgi:hypothetical protein